MIHQLPFASEIVQSNSWWNLQAILTILDVINFKKNKIYE